MKKNKKKMAIIGIVLLTVLILIAVGVNYGSISLTSLAGSCTGFNDIALSSVDYLSNDPVLGGKSWVITVVQNCMGRYAQGSFTRSQITDSNDNAQATKDFKLSMTLDEQTCEYAIREQGFPILAMRQETKYLLWNIGGTDWENTCIERSNLFGRFVRSGFYHTCFWGTETAKHGTLSGADINFKSTIKLEVPGQSPQTATITNQLSRSASIGNIGTAYWNGNIVTGDSCPSAAADKVSVAYHNSVWKMIDESQYQSYLVHTQSSFDNCIDRYTLQGSDSETPDSCIDTYNRVASTALAGKKLMSDGGALGSTYGKVSNGKVVLNPIKTLQYPMITLRLNVDSIGIFIPSSMPEVIYTSSSTFRTGDTGSINAQIKNVGTGYGSFNVYADCSSPFGSSSSRIIPLNENEIKSVSIPVTVSASKDIMGSCTVCAEDVNEASKKHCKSVSMSAKQQIICTPFKRECNGATIIQCNREGTGKPIIQECDLGCEYKNALPTCKQQFKPICGNGVCETGETYLSCSRDCGTKPPVCGNNICETGEPTSCVQDCKITPPKTDTETLGLVVLGFVVLIFGSMIYKEKQKKSGRVRYSR